MALDTPSKGGRVVLTRQAVSETQVSYRVDLHTPDGSWSGEAEIAAGDGAVSLTTLTGEGEPPDWLLDMARAFLRTVWNGRRKEDPPVWPRRLRRWRAPKR